MTDSKSNTSQTQTLTEEKKSASFPVPHVPSTQPRVVTLENLRRAETKTPTNTGESKSRSTPSQHAPLHYETPPPSPRRTMPSAATTGESKSRPSTPFNYEQPADSPRRSMPDDATSTTSTSSTRKRAKRDIPNALTKTASLKPIANAILSEVTQDKVVYKRRVLDECIKRLEADSHYPMDGNSILLRNQERAVRAAQVEECKLKLKRLKADVARNQQVASHDKQAELISRVKKAYCSAVKNHPVTKKPIYLAEERDMPQSQVDREADEFMSSIKRSTTLSALPGTNVNAAADTDVDMVDFNSG